MSDVTYSAAEWQLNIEQAGIASWNEDDPDLVDYPLAQWICKQPYPEANDKHGRTDTGLLMEAVANVLEDEGFEEFSPETFLSVLHSFNGETSNDFFTLVRENLHDEQGVAEHLLDTTIKGIGDSDEAMVAWYMKNGVADGEVYTETNAGGTAYWFKKNEWGL
jgi:hypothetical protein